MPNLKLDYSAARLVKPSSFEGLLKIGRAARRLLVTVARVQKFCCAFALLVSSSCCQGCRIFNVRSPHKLPPHAVRGAEFVMGAAF
jgi:hypothetical protein